mmetsp:Transcript_43989/g.121725  ORF Transcript_43989/g.121725 Transcript_43989/m.121725 type:complete len:403 (-) Transcript_43989:163-1371(-)
MASPTERDDGDASSPSSPWVSAASGKLAFYTQQLEPPALVVDTRAFAASALIFLLVVQRCLREAASAPDVGLGIFLPASLPLLAWPAVLLASTVPAVSTWRDKFVVVATPVTSHAGFCGCVLFGILDASSIVLLFIAGTCGVDPRAQTTLDCSDVLFVEVLRSAAQCWGQQREGNEVRPTCAVAVVMAVAIAAISSLAIVVDDDACDDIDSKSRVQVLDLSPGGAVALAMAAALCRALRIVVGSSLVVPRGLGAAPLAFNLLDVAGLSGMSCGLSMLLASVALKGSLASWPTVEFMPLCALLLCVPPLASVAELVLFRHAPPLAVVALEALHRPLGAISMALFSDSHVETGQLVALYMLLICSAMASVAILWPELRRGGRFGWLRHAHNAHACSNALAAKQL